MKNIITLTIITLLFIGCNDKIEIQKQFDFDVEVMPVQKKIQLGETAEIRCQIKREGKYQETTFYIRYFQPDGYGVLKLDNGTVLQPNDRYKLTRELFRLYYTSMSTEQQRVDIYLEDNFGQVKDLSFTFTNQNADK